MNKPLKLSLFFGITLVSWILAISLSFNSVVKIIKGQKALATFEAPATTTFRVDKAEKITIWHEHITMYNGMVVNNEVALPTGYSFELTTTDGQKLAPMIHTTGTTTVNMKGTSKVGIGTYTLPAAGEYQLIVTGPAEPRIISVTGGTFEETFRKILKIAGIASLLGLVGLVTLIMGIVTLFSKSKSPPPLVSR